MGIGTGNTGLVAAQLPGIGASDLASANALFSNLAGYVTSYTQTFNVFRPEGRLRERCWSNYRNFILNNYAGYVQDNWKTGPRLTLNLGVRYDYWSPVDEHNALALLPIVKDGNPINTLLSNADTENSQGTPSATPGLRRI